MRKLTVKNFSVIKEAELEFGKITVLIGPQSSGKSLLCRLAYFLSIEVIGIAESRINESFDFPSFEEAVKREFEKRFPRTGWGINEWSISFESDGYLLNLAVESTRDRKLVLTFGDEFRNLYIANLDPSSPDIYKAAREFRSLSGKGVWDKTTFIPSERTYFVDTSKAYRSLASDPDPIVKDFALLYENSRNPRIPKPLIQRYLEGNLVRGEDAWQFAFNDGRTLPLSNLSSGSKELHPLLSVLAMYEYERPSATIDSDNHSGTDSPKWLNFDDFFIEEPESHIFPDMQQALVHYFAELSNSDQLRPHFTITTHSPYILTAFNNLIEAGRAAKSLPEQKKKIAKIIKEEYWINQGELTAYKIVVDKNGKGKLESIVDPETGMIDGEYIDQVSESIGNQFDKLLRIEYDYAKET